MKLEWSDGRYTLELDQGEFDFIKRCLLTALTHVSDAEYDIVIGRSKDAGDVIFHDLAFQEREAYAKRIYEELDREGAIAMMIEYMGDLTRLPDEEIFSRIKAEAVKWGQALDGGERRRSILTREALSALFAEVERRGADPGRALRSMLDGEDPGTRLAGAFFSLNRDPAAAVSVLESLSTDTRHPDISVEAVDILRNRQKGEGGAERVPGMGP